MFNSLARKQFRRHLSKVGLPESDQPEVHTFHSFCYQVIRRQIRDGILPESIQFWLGVKEELIWLTVKRAINNLEQARRIPFASVDPDEAMAAISLWKGALLTPNKAGARSSPYLSLVYEEFNMANVVNNGDGSYTVYNLTRGESVSIYSPIPLASAAVW